MGDGRLRDCEELALTKEDEEVEVEDEDDENDDERVE